MLFRNACNAGLSGRSRFHEQVFVGNKEKALQSITYSFISLCLLQGQQSRKSICNIGLQMLFSKNSHTMGQSKRKSPIQSLLDLVDHCSHSGNVSILSLTEKSLRNDPEAQYKITLPSWTNGKRAWLVITFISLRHQGHSMIPHKKRQAKKTSEIYWAWISIMT